MSENGHEIFPPDAPIDMEYRPLGQTGIQLSPMALGGLLAHHGGALGQPPIEEKYRICLRALELGVNLFDLGYTEEVHIPEEMQGNREDLFFALKVGAPTPTEMVEKIDKHLKALRRDAIDILRVHQYAYVARPELVEKVAELRQAGKVRYLCHIRHTAAEQEAYSANGPEPDADADLVIYNYVTRGQEPGIEKSGRAGKGVLIMKALGGGFVSWEDKVRTDWTKATEDTVSQLGVAEISGEFRKVVFDCCFGPWRELAASGCEIPRTNAAVRWILRNKSVSSVLVAVASVEELEEALGVDKATRDLRTDQSISTE